MRIVLFRYCGTSEVNIDDMQGNVIVRFKTNKRKAGRGFSCAISASCEYHVLKHFFLIILYRINLSMDAFIICVAKPPPRE